MKIQRDKLFFSAIVAAVLTVVFALSVGTQAISDNCSALVCVRGVNGVCLERDYAPVCYPSEYLPSCLPNNLPIYGGSSTNPQYGTNAPAAAICSQGLTACAGDWNPYGVKNPDGSWTQDLSCSVARSRPLCPAGTDANASVTGCQPRGATVTPTLGASATATPIPIYGQTTPTPGAQPTDAIPSAALPPLPSVKDLGAPIPYTRTATIPFSQLALIFVTLAVGVYAYLSRKK